MPPCRNLEDGTQMESKINWKLEIAWRGWRTSLEAHLGQILGPWCTKLRSKLHRIGAKVGQDEPSWTKLELSWPKLGQRWTKLEPSRNNNGQHGRTWRTKWTKMEPSWPKMRPSWANLAERWAKLEQRWAKLKPYRSQDGQDGRTWPTRRPTWTNIDPS